MTAPTATPSRPQHHRPHAHMPHVRARISWMAPLTIALFFGAWVGYLEHEGANTTGPGTAILAPVIHGLIATAVMGAICYAIGRYQGGVQDETAAIWYGSVLGCAVGYLFAISGATVYKSTMMGLGLGAIMGISAFYLFHTRRDTPLPGQARSATPRHG
ncbi:hypothetical protein LRS74_12470 [Streptomyces sp. LX-29]|uniref:hypothetical protein n=1 Tax=Streptomyces sp. LX-29 TaxID=2900152 RepID=UPI00240E2B48|nr:hypothetical protein [Streptomyces sp. LX-29]WFB07772.1 hypothetical protein LRS74_12470 [Streptomyces sp. LX-29]